MKRRLFTLALFLLLGAVVNVVVAWAVTTFTTWPGLSQSTSVLRLDTEWPRTVPEHWPELAASFQRRVFGGSIYQYLAYELGERQGSFRSVTREFLINIGSVGVPCRALQWELWADNVLPGDLATGGSYRLNGQPERTWWLTGIPLSSDKFGFGLRSYKRLPIRPLWPGFAVNTLFYGAILWLPIRGPFALRRLHRRKRGLCVACAYDLRGNLAAGCPECGWRREATS